jgi:hypothetical protein
MEATTRGTSMAAGVLLQGNVSAGGTVKGDTVETLIASSIYEIGVDDNRTCELLNGL